MYFNKINTCELLLLMTKQKLIDRTLEVLSSVLQITTVFQTNESYPGRRASVIVATN